jgi:serine protease Do
MPVHRSATDGRSTRSRLGRLAGLLSPAVLGLVLYAALPSATPAGPRLGEANPRRTPIVEAVERVRASVVNIHSERTVQRPSDEPFAMAPSQHRVNGMGTGIVIDPRGYIITNQHVVEDVSVLRVKCSDGSSYSARVLARDGETDLALLKVDAPRPLQTVPLGTAADLMVGETVIAIGNAYGYEHTVSTGIVSAIKRDVTLNKEMSYKSLIQTDAAINPGNSGGPLLNIHGELIGVNVAIRAGAQNIGFAIPVDTMIRVSATMLGQRRGGPWHGMVLRDQVDGTETPVQRSVSVERVEPGTPAATAGVRKGDVLLRVADQRVESSLDLERAVVEGKAGDKLAVTVRRAVEGQVSTGSEVRLELALLAGERTTVAASSPDVVWQKLGVKLVPIGADAVTRVNPQLHGGLTVTDVNADGAAGKAGIQRGDILVGLHTWETIKADNVTFVLTHPDLASFSPVRFYVIRNGQVRRGTLPMD